MNLAILFKYTDLDKKNLEMVASSCNDGNVSKISIDLLYTGTYVLGIVSRDGCGVASLKIYVYEELASSQMVKIGGGESVFCFVPTESREYVFYTIGEYDTVVTLYDSNMKFKCREDDVSGDGGDIENYNAYLYVYLTANTKYYIGVSGFGSNGSFIFKYY